MSRRPYGRVTVKLAGPHRPRRPARPAKGRHLHLRRRRRPATATGCRNGSSDQATCACCWSLYGWPGRLEAEPVDRYLPTAMKRIEHEWARDDRAWYLGAVS